MAMRGLVAGYYGAPKLMTTPKPRKLGLFGSLRQAAGL